MSKIIVTGGAGFIGSHLAEKLAKEGHEIIVIDNLDPFYSIELKKRNLNCVLKYNNASFVEGDICNLDFLRKVINEGTDFVFHEAAQAAVRISVDNPFKPNNVNILGTLNVLKASLEADVKRVINASSSSVYGSIEYLPFDEKHPTKPASPYGVSKLAGENYCRVFYEVYGLPTVSFRYFSVYGPRMRPDLAIFTFTKKMIKNEFLTIFGDGNQTRDFTYIDDVVKANVKVLETNRADGKVINIGSGNRINVNDLTTNLNEIIGGSSNMKYIETQKGDALHTLANIDLANRLLGYLPSVAIEEGLTRFVGWYKRKFL